MLLLSQYVYDIMRCNIKAEYKIYSLDEKVPQILLI